MYLEEGSNLIVIETWVSPISGLQFATDLLLFCRLWIVVSAEIQIQFFALPLLNLLMKVWVCELTGFFLSTL
jgi:hypothetical protein